MWVVMVLLFAAGCFAALGFLCGMIVGIEEERKRALYWPSRRPPAPPTAADPHDKDLATLGVTKLD